VSDQRYAPSLLQGFYDQFYYDTYAFGEKYEAANPHWRQHFARIADVIVAELAPTSVFDLGCGPGLLVQALRRRGVEAFGADISEYAIAHVPKDVREFCSVASITEPLDHSYDLIVCIEVIEHVPRQFADDAVANMARYGQRVLFSSSPDDFKDPSHTNVRPIEYWIGLFARSGMFRDLEFDAGFVTPQAILFTPASSPIEVIRMYERHLFRTTQELREVREANVLIVADRAQLTAQVRRLSGRDPRPVVERRLKRIARPLWRLLPLWLRRTLRG
jgi:SAM-dependent methyltransferase